MITKIDPEELPARTRESSAYAGKERSVRWVYLWLLFASVFMVPWMSLGIRGLEARYREAANPWTGSEPAWSADGQSIAFVSMRSGSKTIYIMNADGTQPRRLLPPSSSYATDYDPDWSSDGHQIAYSSDRTGNFEIYVADLVTGAARQVTENPAHDENPSWSPDGRQIAFWSDRTGDEDIYVMKADGSGVRNLTNDPADDVFPDWSPDGQYLAFNSDRGGNDDIYMMDSDGGNLRQLTRGENDQVWPRWSPDSKALVFNSSAGGRWEIAILRLGVGGTRIEKTLRAGFSPAWSPNGDRIAYCTDVTGRDAVVVMTPDGSDLVNVTARSSAEALAAARVPTSSYVSAVALPAVLLLVLLIPLASRLVYVRRHAQQAVVLAVLRVLSTMLIVGLSRGELIVLWVIVNGGLWIFGGVWGLRQIRRGECWLMRVRGEVSDLPRSWATKPVVPAPTPAGGASTTLGGPSTGEEDQEATIDGLRQMLRTGSPQERQWAIESLQALGEIEEF